MDIDTAQEATGRRIDTAQECPGKTIVKYLFGSWRVNMGRERSTDHPAALHWEYYE